MRWMQSWDLTLDWIMRPVQFNPLSRKNIVTVNKNPYPVMCDVAHVDTVTVNVKSKHAINKK